MYVGVVTYAMSDGYPEEGQPDLRSYLATGILPMFNMKSFYSSIMSFVFDFKGPSMIVDTACAGSGTAFCLAMNDLRLGIDFI